MEDQVTISTYELLKLFPDAEAARLYLEKRRWGGEPVCPHCGCYEHITVRGGKRLGYYWCRDCGKEFTVRTGTIFERSHIPLDKWLLAMYMVVTARKGISSLQLSKELSITQRSAWFMLGRLREALGQPRGDGKLKGVVEVDETYIGGKEMNKHAVKKLNAGRGSVGKQPVIGLRERGGRSIAFPIENVKQGTIRQAIEDNVEPGSEIHTDELASYNDLPGYIRSHVTHGKGMYVGAGNIHVNSVESMWSVFKRGVYGIWHSVSVKHLRRYVNEATFRLDEGNVKIHTVLRLEAFIALAFKCRITYREFIA